MMVMIIISDDFNDDNNKDDDYQWKPINLKNSISSLVSINSIKRVSLGVVMMDGDDSINTCPRISHPTSSRYH